MQEISLALKIKKTLVNILVLIVAMLVAFSIGEIYIRMFNEQQIIPRYSDSGPYGIRKNLGNVRGEMSYREFKHKFNTNSQGFRGKREYTLKKPDDVFRVIVIGDSVTLGIGVEDEETFSGVLEKRLSRSRPAEVINMGVSGFGTAEELIQLINLGFKYDPDLVILAYFPNDPWENVVTKLYKVEDGKLIRDRESFVPAIHIRDRLYKIPGYYYLSQHSHLLNFVRESFSNYYRRKPGKKSNFQSTFPEVLSEEQKEITVLLINEIISEMNKRTIPLIILNIPVKYNNKVFSNMPVDLLKDNDNTYLVDIKREIYADYPFNEVSYEIDCHPRPFGHKLIGEVIEVLIKEKIWREIQ